MWKVVYICYCKPLCSWMVGNRNYCISCSMVRSDADINQAGQFAIAQVKSCCFILSHIFFAWFIVVLLMSVCWDDDCLVNGVAKYGRSSHTYFSGTNGKLCFRIKTIENDDIFTRRVLESTRKSLYSKSVSRGVDNCSSTLLHWVSKKKKSKTLTFGLIG